MLVNGISIDASVAQAMYVAPRPLHRVLQLKQSDALHSWTMYSFTSHGKPFILKNVEGALHVHCDIFLCTLEKFRYDIVLIQVNLFFLLYSSLSRCLAYVVILGLRRHRVAPTSFAHS